MLRKSYHIEMDMKLLELYSDYMISSFGQITATKLSEAYIYVTALKQAMRELHLPKSA